MQENVIGGGGGGGQHDKDSCSNLLSVCKNLAAFAEMVWEGTFQVVFRQLDIWGGGGGIHMGWGGGQHIGGGGGGMQTGCGGGGGGMQTGCGGGQQDIGGGENRQNRTGAAIPNRIKVVWLRTLPFWLT